VARETGLEPATSGVTGRRSNQLSYSPATRHRNCRTGDPPDRVGAGPSQAQREASSAAWRPPYGGASAATCWPSRLATHWWAVTDSNRRPSRCKRDALPTELTAHDRSLLGRQVVAHWVSSVNFVAGYPVYVQNVTRAAFQGPRGLPAAALAFLASLFLNFWQPRNKTLQSGGRPLSPPAGDHNLLFGRE
jgi:hypothetical protein